MRLEKNFLVYFLLRFSRAFKTCGLNIRINFENFPEVVSWNIPSATFLSLFLLVLNYTYVRSFDSVTHTTFSVGSFILFFSLCFSLTLFYYFVFDFTNHVFYYDQSLLTKKTGSYFQIWCFTVLECPFNSFYSIILSKFSFSFIFLILYFLECLNSSYFKIIFSYSNIWILCQPTSFD